MSATTHRRARRRRAVEHLAAAVVVLTALALGTAAARAVDWPTETATHGFAGDAA